MFSEKCAMVLTALTPMHAGSGTELRVVDLPIQREVHTGFPKIEASTLKGCLRDAMEGKESDPIWKTFFGGEGNAEISAAAAVFTDARLLFFPVRSAKGVFALITCPLVLRRFCEDMARIGLDCGSLELPLTEELPLIPSGSMLAFASGNKKNAVMLDEFLYTATVHDSLKIFLIKVQGWFDLEESNQLIHRAIVLSDDDFTDFVLHSTSIVTRIAIDNTGVVKDEALFTEEYLPEESILYSLVLVANTPVRDGEQHGAASLMQRFRKDFPEEFQIGADRTIGKGFVKGTLVPRTEAGGERHG